MKTTIYSVLMLATLSACSSDASNETTSCLYQDGTVWWCADGVPKGEGECTGTVIDVPCSEAVSAAPIAECKGEQETVYHYSCMFEECLNPDCYQDMGETWHYLGESPTAAWGCSFMVAGQFYCESFWGRDSSGVSAQELALAECSAPGIEFPDVSIGICPTSGSLYVCNLPGSTPGTISGDDPSIADFCAENGGTLL